MQQIERPGYTKQQVIDMLHMKYGPRNIGFRYDLLNQDERKIGELDCVEPGGEIQMAKEADIKRTARFRILDRGEIDWSSERIQPFFMLQMSGNQWVEWPLGIFILSTTKRFDKHLKLYRDIEAYDGLVKLKENKLRYRLYISAGSNYVEKAKEVMTGAGIIKFNIEPSDEVLAVDREWEPGTDRLKVVNDLFKDIVYTEVWVDEQGFYSASKYRSPDERAADYAYKTDKLSVVYTGVEEEADLFDVPNEWTVTVSNPDIAPLTSTYTNDNPSSPTSTVRKGFVISKFSTIDYISSQEALDEYTRLLAFKDSQVFGKIPFNTAAMPMHSHNDMIQLGYDPMNIYSKYEELGWTLPLKSNAKMRHELRMVIQV